MPVKAARSAKPIPSNTRSTFELVVIDLNKIYFLSCGFRAASSFWLPGCASTQPNTTDAARTLTRPLECLTRWGTRATMPLVPTMALSIVASGAR